MKKSIKILSVILLITLVFPLVVSANSDLDSLNLDEEEIRLQKEDEEAKKNAEVLDLERFYEEHKESEGANEAQTFSSDSNLATRVAGKNRVETSINISKKAYRNGSKNVVLAGYSGSPDALSGSNLAKELDAPMLLTSKNSLSPNLASEIKRLNASVAYLLGGVGVIPEAIEVELKNMGLEVVRIGGSNRYETSVKIANMSTNKSQVFLSLGQKLLDDGSEDALADALSVGPVSAKNNMPILLSQSDKLPESTERALKNMNVKEVVIVGGNGAISNAIENKIRAMGIKVKRIGGSNRYDTSVKVAETYISKPSNFVIASGNSDVDALVGGYYACKKNAPILLTDTNNLSKETLEYIDGSLINTVILGGRGVISDGTYLKIKSSIGLKPSKGPKATVCIDYGHGGYDPGASYRGRLEKNEAYRLGKLVTKKLKAKGIIVDETRKGDETVTLRQRSSFSNKKNHDYLVSIHRNAVGPEVAHGVETFVHPKSSYKSVKLADRVQKNLVDVGFHNRRVKTANFHMLREVKAPSILVEVGFIDHSRDNSIFDKKQNEIADGIVDGIVEELGLRK